MKKANHLNEAEIALAARSRHRAEAERKCVPADRLATAITEFIEWRAFAYWVRLIAEKQGTSAVEGILRYRCPGFFEYLAKFPEREFLWLQLIDWIDSHCFEDAHSEGWQHALGYYAARDERLDRIRGYWLKCDEQWQPSHRPPDYGEWRRAALADR